MKNLARHSLWLLGSRLAAQAGMAVFSILVARKLGSAAFGEYALIASLLVIGNLLSTFGTDMHLVREIAAHGDLRPLLPALIVQLGLAGILVAAVFTLAPHLSPEGSTALRIFGFSLFPLAFYTVFSTALRGKQQMSAIALLNLLLAFMQASAAMGLYWMNGNLVSLAWCLLAIQVMAAITAGVICLQVIPGFMEPWRQIQPTAIRSLIAACAPMAYLSITIVLYQRLAQVLLPFLAGATPAGHFSVAARLLEVAKIGHIAVFTAIYPMLSKKTSDGPAVLPWGMLLGATALGAVTLTLLANPLISWLFGSEYLPAVPVLRILVWSLLPYTVSNLGSLALLAEKQESAVARTASLSLLVLAGLLCWWGWLSGPQGAAWAILAAESLQCMLLLNKFNYLRNRQALAARRSW